LEVVNAECQAAHTQFAGLFWVINYIAKAVYHYFVVGSEDSTEGQGEVATWGVKQWETWEAGVGTSEVLSGETGEVWELHCEEPKQAITCG